MTKLSVIISIKSMIYLEESLKSVLNQTIEDIEIIFINYTNNDISSILNQYNLKNITILNSEKSNNIINESITKSKGDYITFLDNSDLYLDKKSLSNMYNTAKENDAPFVSSNYQILNEFVNEKEKNVLNNNSTDILTIFPEEYDIKTPLGSNIIKKSFLLENNILYPKSIINSDNLFIVKIITNLKDILISNSLSYCKTLNIDELNTIEKKEEYYNQIKEIFDILKENKLNNLLNKYKREFIDYLCFKEDLENKEIQKIITKLEFEDYFHEEEYGHLIIDSVINPLKTENKEYYMIKECLIEQNMFENKFIDAYLLKEFIKIPEKNNAYNLKRNAIKKIKKINDFYYKHNHKELSVINKLDHENKHFIKINDAILSSNSWKTTKVLRSMKKKTIGDKNE